MNFHPRPPAPPTRNASSPRASAPPLHDPIIDDSLWLKRWSLLPDEEAHRLLVNNMMGHAETCPTLKEKRVSVVTAWSY